MIAFGFSASAAPVQLLGDAIDFTASASGVFTVTAIGGGPADRAGVVVGDGGEYSLCIGPNLNDCSTSGAGYLLDVGESTVTFSLFGGTNFVVGTGTVDLVISGIDEELQAVTGGPLVMHNGVLSLQGFDAHSMTFRVEGDGGLLFIPNESVTFEVFGGGDDAGVVADAGDGVDPPARRALLMGCGCSSSGAGSVLAGLLAGLAWLRRRTRIAFPARARCSGCTGEDLGAER